MTDKDRAIQKYITMFASMHAEAFGEPNALADLPPVAYETGEGLAEAIKASHDIALRGLAVADLVAGAGKTGDDADAFAAAIIKGAIEQERQQRALAASRPIKISEWCTITTIIDDFRLACAALVMACPRGGDMTFIRVEGDLRNPDVGKAVDDIVELVAVAYFGRYSDDRPYPVVGVGPFDSEFTVVGVERIGGETLERVTAILAEYGKVCETIDLNVDAPPDTVAMRGLQISHRHGVSLCDAVEHFGRGDWYGDCECPACAMNRNRANQPPAAAPVEDLGAVVGALVDAIKTGTLPKPPSQPPSPKVAALFTTAGFDPNIKS